MQNLMIDFIISIQNLSSPILNWVLTIFNLLSQQYFLILLVTTVYWLINKQKGEQLASALIFTTCLSCGIKGVFCVDRPFIADSRVKALNQGTAPGYSFPSADSSAASSIATTLGTMTKKPVLWVLLGCYALIIGFCRMYFGLHYPTDVLGGLLVGVVVSVAVYLASKKLSSLNIFYIAFGVLLLTFILFPNQQKDYFNSLGLVIGAICGIILEHKFVNFTCRITKGKKTLRMIFGLLGLIIIAVFCSLFLPGTPFFMIVDKFALTFFATFVYPLIFTKLGF